MWQQHIATLVAACLSDPVPGIWPGTGRGGQSDPGSPTGQPSLWILLPRSDASLAAPLHPQCAPVPGALGLGGGSLAFQLGGAGLKHHLRGQAGVGPEVPRLLISTGHPSTLPPPSLLFVGPRVPCSLPCLRICSLFRTALPCAPTRTAASLEPHGGPSHVLVPALTRTPAPVSRSDSWLYRGGSGRFLEAG